MGETGTDGQMGSSESSLHPLMIPAHSCGGVGPLPFHVSPSEGASWRCGDCQADRERTRGWPRSQGPSTMDSHHGSYMENTNFPKSGWVHHISLIDKILPSVGRLSASATSCS